MAAYSSRSSSLVGLAITDASLLGALAEVHQQRRVAAVVEDHVRAFAFAALRPELEDAVRVVPVVGQRLALVGEHRRAAGDERGGGVVLRREDVARGPAHLGAERLQRLDQHGGLDRHVQRAGDARALERLALRELVADRHQAGHLGLGDPDFLAAPVGERRVGNGVLVGVQRFQNSVHRDLHTSWKPAALAGGELTRTRSAGERRCNEGSEPGARDGVPCNAPRNGRNCSRCARLRAWVKANRRR